jgi:hypothetical protein
MSEIEEMELLQGILKEASVRTGKNVSASEYSFFLPEDFIIRKRILVDGQEVGDLPVKLLTTDNIVAVVNGEI